MSGLPLPLMGWEAFKDRHEKDKRTIFDMPNKPMPARKRRLIAPDMPKDRDLYSVFHPGLDADTKAPWEDQPGSETRDSLYEHQEPTSSSSPNTHSGASTNEEASVSSDTIGNSADEDTTAIATTVETHVSDFIDLEDNEVKLLRLKFARLALDDNFHQFSRFPPEIRRLIWRHTWDHRTVMISRRILGTCDNTAKEIKFNDGTVDDARTIRDDHHFRNLSLWDPKGSSPGPYQGQYIITYTKSNCTPPISLWVCWESRHETMEHFGLALRLPGGVSSICFNFDLDILYWTLHSPLSAAFSRKDMSKLTRVSIPELAPAVPSFVELIPLWNPEPDRMKRQSEEDKRYKFEEFKYVWRLLRRWFPALREITIQPFHQCDCYAVTKKLEVPYPINIVDDLDYDIPDFDDFCESCFNIQESINRYFPTIGTSDGSAQDDVDRILDQEDILEPVYKAESIVIGTVPAAKSWEEDEEVIVNYLAIHDNEPRTSSTWDLEAETRNMDVVRRKCIAYTLEHAFGRQGYFEPPIFNM
ncbi:hypothetical protein F5X99DRAFT_428132 [Biscogniauxia marginata]|nr:hypothetical protein F5X99DRAFT_428132 [Biscogniauxia marginata]